ncbi:DNA-protecting protein DprA [Oceanispirochaeta crateris]|uniref:DNA-protecting protein DprA n=1 Tax=Oceanispirochaeta crateris TaxID=2518645 RepID=A0A5C1QL12_9SPIO|nr:DNA-processing protein DprA [Oceanispirochaeta crateris]QEN07899.1 DNA-protecting protein DprA [Oceanispirochaeta crateris]
MIDLNVLFALNRLGSLKLNEKLKILNGFSSPDLFSRVSLYEMEWLLGRKLRMRSFEPDELMALGEGDLKKTNSLGIRWTWYGGREYPSILKEIYDPPFILFWKGSLPSDLRESLAVVGTRKPTLQADRSAYALGLDAATAGIPLISGMAAGIDGAAHRGALAGGGVTWAVLGTGCDKPYPRAHRKLAAEIVTKGGGLISEFVPGTGPVRYNFPKRNRIISGLSQSVVIVQAPGRSGALHTADFALDQGRDVYVHENGLSGRTGRGSALLADQGAPVIGCLKDIYPNLESPGHSMEDAYPMASGTTVEAASMASKMMRYELKDQLKFYKGRVQF